MVNTNRVKKKIPSLLLDSNSTTKQGWRDLMRNRYHYAQFNKRNPERCNILIDKIVTDLKELEKAVLKNL